MATAASKLEPKVVPPAEWLNARVELLKKEKELTHLRDELNRQRQELPWEKIEKNYVFESANGKESLADLFGGRSQLIVYHFMFGPEWKEGCPSCSMIGDHIDGSVPHLAARDVRLVAVSRAPYAQIEAFQKRMGWKFHWASSFAQRFQSRLPRFCDQAGSRSRRHLLQLRHAQISQRRAPRRQRLLQRCRGQCLPHLFGIRPRPGTGSRRLQLARHRAQRPQRRRSTLAHGLGPPPRQIRAEGSGRHKRPRVKDRPQLLCRPVRTLNN